MFGFLNHHHPLQQRRTRPMVAIDDQSDNEYGDHDTALMDEFTLPEGLELVAKSDIFSRQSEGHVLLMRQGNVVAPQALPKLIRHGADPSQFVFREKETLTLEKAPHTTLPDGLSRHASHIDHTEEPAGHQADNARIVMIIPNEDRLEKTLTLLDMSGVKLSDVQCSANASQLIPFVQHHEPSILIVDEDAHPMTSMVPKLNALKRAYHIQHVILTVSKQDEETDHEFGPISRDKIIEQAEASGIEVVYKPYNVFGLSRMLRLYKARKFFKKQVDSAQHQ